MACTSMHHDVGGEDLGAIDVRDKKLAFWERQVHALFGLLVIKDAVNSHEVRRAIEALLPESYDSLSRYYEKWTAALVSVLVERRIITHDEVEKELGIFQDDPESRFKNGDIVKVRNENLATRWRRPHLRTPGYIYGAIGEVVQCLGLFHNPEKAAFQQSGPRQPLYTVRFAQKQLWQLYDGSPNDTVDAEIFQHWLEPATKSVMDSHSQPHIHHHDHKHKHHAIDHGDHTHDARTVVEQKAIDEEGDDTERKKVTEALIRVLYAKGVITADELRKQIEEVDTWCKTMLGPKIVAHAWADPAFKERLLRDSRTALLELSINFGSEGTENPSAVKLIVVESTPTLHHLVVCTLCSCYPWELLGPSPPWYRSRSYRGKAVRDPRGTLKEFGLELPSSITIQVHDSTSEIRYLVIPARPTGTEGWTEEQLATLVNRDSMIGVSLASPPTSS